MAERENAAVTAGTTMRYADLAAAIGGVKARTVANFASEHNLPRTKIGRHAEVELDAFIRAARDHRPSWRFSFGDGATVTTLRPPSPSPTSPAPLQVADTDTGDLERELAATQAVLARTRADADAELTRAHADVRRLRAQVADLQIRLARHEPVDFNEADGPL